MTEKYYFAKIRANMMHFPEVSTRLRAERILIPTFNERNLKVSILFANVARWMRKASSAPSVVYLKEMREKGSKGERGTREV